MLKHIFKVYLYAGLNR